MSKDEIKYMTMNIEGLKWAKDHLDRSVKNDIEKFVDVVIRKRLAIAKDKVISFNITEGKVIIDEQHNGRIQPREGNEERLDTKK